MEEDVLFFNSLDRAIIKKYTLENNSNSIVIPDGKQKSTLSPVKSTVSESSTILEVSSTGIFPAERRPSNNSVKSAKTDISEGQKGESSFSLGQLIFTSLFGSTEEKPWPVFISKLIDGFASGALIDQNVLYLIMEPENGLVTAEILDKKLFSAEVGIYKDPFHGSQTIISPSTSLTPDIRNFVSGILNEVKTESAADMLRVGLIYYNGIGIPKDYSIAFKWFVEASKKKSLEALVYVGVCYLKGEGTTKNEALAFQHFQKAAKQKDSLAMLYFSTCYRNGIGCEIDVDRARKWLERSANTNADAQFQMAVDYETGSGIFPQNRAQSLEHYKKAAINGHVLAAHNLGCIYRSGRSVDVDYHQSLKWFTLAAEKGHAPSQNNLAYLFEHGLGQDEDYKSALYWYQKSCNQKYPPAQNNLAFLYMNGKGVAKDSKMAFNLYTLSAAQGYVEAQHHLARCYLVGEGTEQDIKQAHYWYGMAAAAGNPNSYNDLGLCYEYGIGVPLDKMQALQNYQMAANFGEVSALFNLADLYENEFFNYPMALKFYKMASSKGDLQSLQRMEQLELECRTHKD
ncbi:hypothetical protein HK103_006138 [Boothiomyces macroporosus]|uniref:HCP-like protein n=1 Tax=Boothiomyces macroporosus TaxID=261099 RepID=A0AAD5Y4W5_9FUNG|nr:hypothetical protein HK103_006138 [Boothiomyces macroporosus]